MWCWLRQRFELCRFAAHITYSRFTLIYYVLFYGGQSGHRSQALAYGGQTVYDRCVDERAAIAGTLQKNR